MSRYTANAVIRFLILLVIACCATPGAVLAENVTLKDAVQCRDFEHNRDGSWYAPCS